MLIALPWLADQPEVIAPGAEAIATQLMEEFRQEAEAVGTCLHLNHMTNPLPSDGISTRGVNSVTAYGWMKLGGGEGYAWPETRRVSPLSTNQLAST